MGLLVVYDSLLELFQSNCSFLICSSLDAHGLETEIPVFRERVRWIVLWCMGSFLRRRCRRGRRSEHGMKCGGRCGRRYLCGCLGRSMNRSLILRVSSCCARGRTDKSGVHLAVKILLCSYGTYKHNHKGYKEQNPDDYEGTLFAGWFYPFSLFQKCRIRSYH